LRAAFEIFDSDGNGQISMDELKQIFGRGQASEKDELVWKEIMDSADED
jgi:Ca2+-binding EF-hand superfamily protein